MIKKLLTIICISIVLSLGLSAQDAETRKRWREFDRYNLHKIDFSKTRLTMKRLEPLKTDEYIDDFSLLRGVVFGKRGRVFKERTIQDYLERQPWYRPNRNFTNAMLTPLERANLDLIRLAEAEKHIFVEPGDMRIWKTKLITDDNLRDYTGAELTILAAEIEAIRGKTFSEEWLQKYFDERYWYKRNPAYDASTLTDIERKNIARIHEEKEKNRKAAISIGDMGNFQNVALTEDKLAGLSILELRILREEF